MDLGRLLFTPPRFRAAAAPVAIQQPAWFKASDGTPHLSARDCAAYDRGRRTFEARGELTDAIGTPAWRGYHAALAEASARTLDAAQ
jgi:hypothetical protein